MIKTEISCIGRIRLILDVTFDPGRYKKAAGWAFAAALAVGDAERAEKLLAGRPLDLWLNSVRDWYTAIAQPHRERWKQDFSALMEHLEKAEQVKERRMDCWDERDGKYPHLWQLFEILTMPEVPAETVQSGRRGTERLRLLTWQYQGRLQDSRRKHRPVRETRERLRRVSWAEMIRDIPDSR